MSRRDYKTCRRCHEHSDAAGPLSHTRLCRTCQHAKENDNLDDLVEHSGAGFLRWRRRIAASVGAVLLDDLAGEP